MHMNIWTPNMTTFRVKLVDFGPNGMFEENGDNTEHEIIVENPGQSQWLSLDVPLTDFVNLANRKNIAQLILSGLPVAAGDGVSGECEAAVIAGQASQSVAPTPRLQTDYAGTTKICLDKFCGGGRNMTRDGMDPHREAGLIGR
jgi:hypothetical protein